MKKVTASYKWSKDYAKSSWSDTVSFETDEDVKLSWAFMTSIKYLLNAHVQMVVLQSVSAEGFSPKGITEEEYVGSGIIAPKHLLEKVKKYKAKMTDEDKATREYEDFMEYYKLVVEEYKDLKNEYIDVYNELTGN